MEQIKEQEDIIPESKAARWAWRVSLIPLLGVPLYFILASIAMYRIGQGRTGVWLLRRGAIAIFLISILPYFGLYLSGYSMYYPWVYDNLYSYLPRHGVLINSESRFPALSPYRYHIFFGNLRVRVEVLYKNGQKSYESHVITETASPLTDANLYHDGKWTCWHENGEKSGSGQYKRGISIGRWEYWDESGNLIREETYGDTGVMQKVIEYKDGKPVKTTLYDKDGKPIEEKK